MGGSQSCAAGPCAPAATAARLARRPRRGACKQTPPRPAAPASLPTRPRCSRGPRPPHRPARPPCTHPRCCRPARSGCSAGPATGAGSCPAAPARWPRRWRRPGRRPRRRRRPPRGAPPAGRGSRSAGGPAARSAGARTPAVPGVEERGTRAGQRGRWSEHVRVRPAQAQPLSPAGLPPSCCPACAPAGVAARRPSALLLTVGQPAWPAGTAHHLSHVVHGAEAVGRHRHRLHEELAVAVLGAAQPPRRRVARGGGRRSRAGAAPLPPRHVCARWGGGAGERGSAGRSQAGPTAGAMPTLRCSTTGDEPQSHSARPTAPHACQSQEAPPILISTARSTRAAAHPWGRCRPGSAR